MIREKALLFKLNQIKISDSQLLKFTPISDQTCPRCGARGCCWPHGSYRRGLISTNNDKRVDAIISVGRVLCSSCGSTHALLPDILIPFGSYSLRFVLHVLRAYLFRSGTLTALCDHFFIAHSTLYKWIHLFNEQANLLFSAVAQIAWINAKALDFIEEIPALPWHFFQRYGFSFLQNTKRQSFSPDSG